MKYMTFAVIGFIFIMYFTYFLMPSIYFRLLLKTYWLNNKKGKEIILSFDDGPDPRYTCRLLQILKKYGIKAIFFVVAEKAALYPEIIMQIINSGHIIGLHSYGHRDAWASRPVLQNKDFNKGLSILEGLGVNAALYRPPWGHLSIWLLYLAKKHKIKTLLWTVMAQDWKKRNTPQKILKRLEKRTKNGGIVCLHDSGCGKGAAQFAPENTIEAVSEFIPLMMEKGYNFVIPDEII